MNIASNPSIPVSWGEIFDKASILEIKAGKISASSALKNVRTELDLLSGHISLGLKSNAGVGRFYNELREINQQLWDIEDKIREKEAEQDFGPEFIALARSVYLTNDKRSKVKREINTLLNSALVEEKSYQSY